VCSFMPVPDDPMDSLMRVLLLVAATT
jgi:hypothetical protein